MDRILVAVDGSEAALKAVGFAARLAADTKAELAILTVLDEVYVADRALREFAHSEHLAATWGDISEARATEILIGPLPEARPPARSPRERRSNPSANNRTARRP